MAALAAILFLLQHPAPFWESKPPAEWSLAECRQLLTGSPWVQSDGVNRVYITSAQPVRLAEERLMDAREESGEAPADLDPEYLDFVRERSREYIIVAVHMPNPTLMSDPREAADVAKESRIKIGKRKYKLAAHFPPTPGDPVLRLIFPKKIAGDEKTLTLELYIPGTPTPWRNYEFPLKSLLWKGKPEF
jgi:hypothetical protein